MARDFPTLWFYELHNQSQKGMSSILLHWRSQVIGSTAISVHCESQVGHGYKRAVLLEEEWGLVGIILRYIFIHFLQVIQWVFGIRLLLVAWSWLHLLLRVEGIRLPPMCCYLDNIEHESLEKKITQTGIRLTMTQVQLTLSWPAACSTGIKFSWNGWKWATRKQTEDLYVRSTQTVYVASQMFVLPLQSQTSHKSASVSARQTEAVQLEVKR